MNAADDMGDDENWTGGFYELMLILGPAHDERLDRAAQALWRAAGIRGSRPIGHQDDIQPGAAAFRTHGHLRGTLTLPSAARVVCGGFTTRYEDADTIELYLPLGSLARIDHRSGAFPFDERSGAESLTWREPLDTWLADIARAVHADVTFQRALIGFEIDEDDSDGYAAALTPRDGVLHYRPATT